MLFYFLSEYRVYTCVASNCFITMYYSRMTLHVIIILLEYKVTVYTQVYLEAVLSQCTTQNFILCITCLYLFLP